jgi:predicted metal-dependent hydrolase
VATAGQHRTGFDVRQVGTWSVRLCRTLTILGLEMTRRPVERALRLIADTKVWTMSEYPEQYLEGIRLFNEEEFFEAHDVLEELWSDCEGSERKFIQGLIQSAVALFHFGNENRGGALKLYHSSRKYLEPYGEKYWGIDLSKFRADFQHCFQELLDSKDIHNSGIVIQDERVPRIEFSAD